MPAQKAARRFCSADVTARKSGFSAPGGAARPCDRFAALCPARCAEEANAADKGRSAAQAPLPYPLRRRGETIPPSPAQPPAQSCRLLFHAFSQKSESVLSPAGSGFCSARRAGGQNQPTVSGATFSAKRQAFAPFPAGRQKHPRPGARAEAASAPFPARQGERLSSYLLLIVLFCPVFLSPSPAGRWKAVFRRPDQLLFSLGGITDFLFPVAGHQLSATEQISKQ